MKQKMTLPDYYQTTLTPKEEIHRRISAFQDGLKEINLSAALIHQDVDLFYLCGTMQQAFLFVPSQGEPLLLVKKDLSRALAESPLSHIKSLPSVGQLAETIVRYGYRIPDCLGLELDCLPISTYRFLKEKLLWKEDRDISIMLRKIRAAKSDFEIAQMRTSGEIGRRLYQAIPELLRPGLTEIDLAGLMIQKAVGWGDMNLLRSRGFNSAAFNWHVISGESGACQSRNDAPFAGLGQSPAFPMGAGLKPIREGEPVLIDFGNCYNGYQTDQTRMFSIRKPAKEFIKAHQALQEIETHLLEHLRPGNSAESLYRMALEDAKKLGYTDSFLGPRGQKVKYVAHGLGLEIDEFPFLAQGHNYPLKEGMTLALELKIVLEKAAVGFENTVVIQKNGVEKLTTADEAFIVI
ncbi:MAG: aminopeptidase P family protein [Desulfobacca sp.]|nr:aminopeptidase P family protein [Desulfobacca sp.]